MKKPEKHYIQIDNKVDDYQNKPIFKEVDRNLDYIRKTMGESMDIIGRDMYIENTKQRVKIGIIHLDGLVDAALVNDTILESLSLKFNNIQDEIKEQNLFEYFHKNLIMFAEVYEGSDYSKLFNQLLLGNTIFFVDGIDKFLAIGSKGFRERAVEKPETHITVKGSKESCTENIITNVSLIRRRIRNPNLWFKRLTIGKTSNTVVTLVYINGLADDKLVNEVIRRLEKIQTTDIIEASYISYYLKDNVSIFPTIYDTERPDTIAANLFDGRVAIIVDGSPFVVIAPSTFLQFVQSPEDFTQKAIISSFFRLLRFFAFFISYLLPSLYLCVIMFHSELLPLNLLFSVAGQRQGVPLPAILEIFLLMIAFDLLREAGTRMPSSLGSSLSFVGAIIIGQSAVEAGLISAIVVIVVTVTGIASLALPDYDLNLTVTILRYAFLLSAAFFGLVGVALASVVLINHLTTLRSFGVSYLIPFAPFNIKGLKDSIIRFPLGKVLKKKKNITNEYPY